MSLLIMWANLLISGLDRKSTRLNSSHLVISYAVFCLKKKNSNDTMALTGGAGPYAPRPGQTRFPLAHFIEPGFYVSYYASFEFDVVLSNLRIRVLAII